MIAWREECARRYGVRVLVSSPQVELTLETKGLGSTRCKATYLEARGFVWRGAVRLGVTGGRRPKHGVHPLRFFFRSGIPSVQRLHIFTQVSVIYQVDSSSSIDCDGLICQGGIAGELRLVTGAVPNIVHPLRFFFRSGIPSVIAYAVYTSISDASLLLYSRLPFLHPIWLRPLFVPLVFGYWYVSWSACRRHSPSQKVRCPRRAEVLFQVIYLGEQPDYGQRILFSMRCYSVPTSC